MASINQNSPFSRANGAATPKGTLQGLGFSPLTATPAGLVAADAGRLWWRNDLQEYNYWDGSAVQNLTDTNFAENDLTADANRTHDFGAFSLQIDYTSGANTASSVMDNTGYTYSVADATNSTSLQATSTGIDILATDGVNGGGITVDTSTVNLQFAGTADLQVDGSAGTAGQVLTSGGAGAAPTWSAVPADVNIYNSDGTLTGNRTVTMSSNTLNFSGGNVGINNANPFAPLHFENVVDNRKLALFQLIDNDHQFYGFGVNSRVLRYQTDDTLSDHIFYAATSSTTSQELFRINGDQTYQAIGLGTGGAAEMVVADSVGVLTTQAIPVDTNFAEDDLTATGNRTHTFATNNLQIDYTTGDLTHSFIDGSDTNTITGSATGYSAAISDGTNSTSLSMLALTASLSATDGTNGGTVRVTDGGIDLVFAGTGDLEIDSDAGTAGQVLQSNGSGAAPTWVTPSTGNPWVNVTGTSQTLAASTNYVANNAGLVTFTLPVTASFGDTFKIVGNLAGGWTIAQNGGQTIHIGTSSTTTGVSGSVSSTAIGDTIELVCVGANTDFRAAEAPQGNLTIV